MAPELGLDLKLSAMKIISGFSKEASAIEDREGRLAKLEDYVNSLEEERRKIEVFKRELPLCLFLLNDVIGAMKDEVEQCQSERYPNAGHVLEEFMPVKSKLDEEGGVKLEKDCKDKMNWMSSAQLWSDNYSDDNRSGKRNTEENAEESDHRQESENLSLESKSKTGRGAFVPFKGLSALSSDSRKEEKVTVGLPDLSLVSPGIKTSRPVSVVPEDHRSGVGSSCKAIGRGQVSSSTGSHASLQAQQQQAARKARRCWSPELHRRFVVALQQLGGAQATPKQIRELMKVDGLTNDEVKSHLQKYRLHTRRMPNSSGSGNRSVVVMGGLWVPQENCTASQQSAAQSGSPQGPLQLAASSRAISVTAGDSCEEDGKSESYSWK